MVSVGRLRLILNQVILAMTLFATTGCGLSDLEVYLGNLTSNELSGSVVGFSSLDASTLSTCTGSNVSLYSIDGNGRKDQLLATTSVDSLGLYQFSGLKSQGVDVPKKGFTETKYMVEFECSGTVNRRFVDGYENQNLSEGTTLLTWISQTEAADHVTQQSSASWSMFLEDLQDETTLADAYNTLISSTELTSLFTTQFGVAPTVMVNAAPRIQTATVPLSWTEESAQTLSLQTEHWWPSYNQVQQWKIGSTLLSSATSFSFTPTANEQGAKTLTLLVGQDDGAGAVDLTKPYTQQNYSLSVANNLPAVAPSLALVSSAATASTAAQLRMTTGTLTSGVYEHCKTFSNLVLVEEAYPAVGLAPSSAASYNLSCTDAGTQDINLTLSGTEGYRTLRLWVIDAAGNTSAVSSDVDVLYDATAPVVNLTSLTGGQILRGGQSVSITWGASDSYPRVNPIELDYSADGGSTWTSMVGASSNSGSYNWTVPSINTSQLRVRVTMFDAAGASTSSASTSNLTVDSSLPSAPVFARTTAEYSSTVLVGLSVTCDADYTAVAITTSATAPLLSDSAWQACAATMNYAVSTTNGLKTLYMWSQDTAGNISVSPNSVTMVYDNTSPALAFTNAPTLAQKGGAAFTLNFTVTEANITNADTFNLEISQNNGGSWSALGSVTSTNGPLAAQSFGYNFNWPAVDAAQVQLRLSTTDLAGNSTTITSAAFIVDNTPPTISSSSFKLNGSATPATASNVNFAVEFAAQDSGSKMKSFCMKYNSSTAPLSADTCWIDFATLGLTEALSLAVTPTENYYFQTGYGIGAYDVYLWVRDEAGQMSSLTNSGSGTVGTDLIEASYDPGTPPTISVLSAIAVDNPANPPSTANLQVPAGSNVFVRWRVTDDNALPAGAIQLYYYNPSTSLWVLVPGATALNNGANGACTVDDPLTTAVETGCFLWSSGSPTSDAYQIRLVVTDTATQSNQSVAAPLNTNNFKIIAGNMDPGLGGNARSAIIYSKGFGEIGYPKQFVVAPNGNVFIADSSRGLLRIKPSDGLLKVFIPYTGTNAGYDGPASGMTLAHFSIYAVSLDQQGRVLFMNNEGIFRFSPSEDDPVITRIIGGGGSSSDGTAPLSYLINDTQDNRQLFTTPNGRIYFSHHSNLRYYDPSLDQIHTINITGFGHHIDGAVDITQCTDRSGFGAGFDFSTSALNSFFFTTNSYAASCGGTPGTPIVSVDPVTFASKGAGFSPNAHPTAHWSYHVRWSSGVNGDLYAIAIAYGKIFKYNIATNTLDLVVGTTSQGRCEDGVQALSCAVVPLDVFVDKFGKIYFLDAGQIRTVQSDGTILTLYGAWKSEGNGVAALSARSSRINTITQSNDGKIQFLNADSHLVREFEIGGQVNTIAGNGTSSGILVGVPAASNPIAGQIAWGGANSFATDPATGDIYMGNIGGIHRLDRTTGLWSSASVGGGATDYRSADGLAGTNIMLNWIKPVLWSANKLFATSRHHHGIPGDQYNAYVYNAADSFRQTTLIGNNDISTPSTSTNACADGQIGTACFFAQDEQSIFASMSAYDSVDDIFYIGYRYNSIIARNSSGTINVITLPAVSGRINHFTYRRSPGTPDNEYIYWSETTQLHRFDLNTMTNTTLYTFPIGFSTQAETNMIWDETRKKVIFPIIQNGLHGIAEYYDP